MLLLNISHQNCVFPPGCSLVPMVPSSLPFLPPSFCQSPFYSSAGKSTQVIVWFLSSCARLISLSSWSQFHLCGLKSQDSIIFMAKYFFTLYLSTHQLMDPACFHFLVIVEQCWDGHGNADVSLTYWCPLLCIYSQDHSVVHFKKS